MKKNKPKLMLVAGLSLLLGAIVLILDQSKAGSVETETSEVQSATPKPQEVHSERASEPKLVSLTYRVKEVAIGKKESSSLPVSQNQTQDQ